MCFKKQLCILLHVDICLVQYFKLLAQFWSINSADLTPTHVHYV